MDLGQWAEQCRIIQTATLLTVGHNVKDRSMVVTAPPVPLPGVVQLWQHNAAVH